MSAPYSYELIKSGDTEFYRIRDAEDNKVAACYVLENAELLVTALNFTYGGDPVMWVCGHRARSHCAECYQELAAKAATLAQDLLEAKR